MEHEDSGNRKKWTKARHLTKKCLPSSRVQLGDKEGIKDAEVSKEAFRIMTVMTLRVYTSWRGTFFHFRMFEIQVLAKLPRGGQREFK